MKLLVLLLTLVCRLSAAVAVDASSTATARANGVLTMDLTTLTIGSISNGALVCSVHWAQDPGAITVANWDQAGTPQAMTLIVAGNNGAGRYASLYGLVAPTAGNKTFRLTWTNGSDVNMFCKSFSGVNQTGGATSFPNSTTATATSTTATITITSATGDWTVSAITTPSADPSAPNRTQDYIDTANNNNNAAGENATGAASLAHTWTLSASNAYIMVGTSIAAASAATPLLTRRPVSFQ